MISFNESYYKEILWLEFYLIESTLLLSFYSNIF